MCIVCLVRRVASQQNNGGFVRGSRRDRIVGEGAGGRSGLREA